MQQSMHSVVTSETISSVSTLYGKVHPSLAGHSTGQLEGIICMECRQWQHLCEPSALLLLLAACAGSAAGLLRALRGARVVLEAGLVHEVAHALAGGAAAGRLGLHGLDHRGGHLSDLGAGLQPVEVLHSSASSQNPAFWMSLMVLTTKFSKSGSH